MRIDNNHLVALLDTGSSISAINKEVANNLEIKKINTPLTMRSASGTFLVTEAAYALIDYGLAERYHWLFVIPTLTKGVLLGNDFLSAVGVSIHPAENKISKDGDYQPFCKVNGQPVNSNSTHDLHLVEHINDIRKNCKIDFDVENEFHKLLEEYSDIFDDKPSTALA